jgi:antitoxin YefM
LASILDRASETLEPILIERRGKKDVALIDAAELEALEETRHLLSSPANARALFESLEEARSGKAIAMTLEELRARAKKRGEVSS